MNTPGLIIDGKYKVINVLSTKGGMGTLLVVHAVADINSIFALKYCLATDSENLDRFRREVRIMQDFAGNSKVVQVADSNLGHTPPYFVMPVYTDGDLSTLSPQILNDKQSLERYMLAMADCVGELHLAGKHHRDIKPANFLRTQNGIVISDFGLGMDLMSQTGGTRTSQAFGTLGYAPPEFYHSGGFKNATVRSDIFMLGKAFYNFVTGHNPQFIDKSQIEKPLFYLIDRCCKQDPAERYQSVPELKQGIVSAFDIILGRMAPLGQAQAKFAEIVKLLEQRQYKTEDIKSFVGLAENLTPEELFSIIAKADEAFYFVLSQLQHELKSYLELYHNAILSQQYLSFTYAELVADRMNIVFQTCTDPDLRARALEIAIIHAVRNNRFAAMSTCSNMITRTPANDPAESAIVAVLQNATAAFVKNIEPTSCQNPVIANQIQRLANS